MRYSCLAPGKRLRPTLLIVTYEAVAGRDASLAAISAAAAVEMVHAFSLIHDDLPAIDNDDLRRGRPTCHKVFGEALAILAGDALFALAFEAILSEVNEHTALAALTLAKASGSNGLVGGEVDDVLAEGKAVTKDDVASIHARKTGALIAASCEIGAILAGANRETCARHRTYGELVGLSFQIADDLLNEFGTAEQLGKAVGSDRDRQKATYPAVIGVKESQAVAQHAVEAAIRVVPGNDRLISLAQYAVSRLT